MAAAAETTEKRSVALGRAVGTAVGKFAAFLAAGTVMTKVATTMRDFGDAMAKVQAISGATSTEFAKMRELAIDLGASTEFSASQAAGGLEFLAMAGFNASEAIAALPGVLDLATASGMGLAETADIASNVLSGFGKQASEIASVTDALAKQASISNTNVAQLGQAMSYAAPVANTLGISIGEAAAAIGVLSDAGVQGGRAGNTLRTMLTKLVQPTDAAAEVLRDLGLSLDDVDVQAKGLDGVLQTLAAANIELADATELVGLEAASNLILLTEGVAKYKEYTEAQKSASGTTEEMATIMRDTLGGSMRNLSSAVEGLMIALGDAGLTTVITGLVNGMTTLVRGLTSAVSAIAQFYAAISGSVSPTTQLSAATDTLVSATKAEIDAMRLLIPEMASAVRESGSLTTSKLEEATALRSSAGAKIADARATLMMSQAYQDLITDIAETTELVRLLSSPREGDESSIVAEQLEAQRQKLVELLNTQSEMTAGFREQEAALRDIDSTIAAIRDGTYDAANGANVMSGQLSIAEQLAAALHSWLSGVAGAADAGAGASSRLGGALQSAAQAALSLASALSQAVGYLGAVGTGLASLASRATVAGQATGILGNVLGRVINSDAVQAAADKLGKIGNVIGIMHRSSVKAAPGIAKLNEELAGRSGGGSGSGGTAKAAKEATTFVEGFDEAMKNAANTAAETGTKFANILVSGIDGVSDAFGKLLTGSFDSFQDFAKSILRTFQSMLAEMISLALRNRIMISMGFGNTGGSSSGIGAALTGGGSTGGGIGNLFSGIWGTAGSPGLFGGSGLFGLGGGSGFLGLGAGSGLATTLSSGIGGILSVGAFALGAVGLIGGLIGSLKRELKDVSIVGEFGGDGFEGHLSEYWGGNLFSGARVKRKALSDGLQESLDRAFGQIRDGVMEMASVLGFGSDALDGFSHKFQLSISGLSEDDQIAAIERELGDVAAEIASHIFGSDRWLRAGETALDAMGRMATALTVVNQAFDLLGHTVFEASARAGDAASRMVDIAGGIEAFTSAVNSYYENFFTESERIEATTRRMTEALAEFGISLPVSRLAFRELVESIDTTTVHGQDLYATMISLADAFASVTPAGAGFSAGLQRMVSDLQESVLGRITEATDLAREHRQSANVWGTTADTLKDLVHSLKGGIEDVLGVRDEGRLRANLGQVFASAMAGDLSAAQSFPQLAQEYLQALEASSGSAVEFEKAAKALTLQSMDVAASARQTATAEEVMANLLEAQVEILQDLFDFLNFEGVSISSFEDLEAFMGSLDESLGHFNARLQSVGADVFSFLGAPLGDISEALQFLTDALGTDAEILIDALADLADELNMPLGLLLGELGALSQGLETPLGDILTAVINDVGLPIDDVFSAVNALPNRFNVSMVELGKTLSKVSALMNLSIRDVVAMLRDNPAEIANLLQGLTIDLTGLIQPLGSISVGINNVRDGLLAELIAIRHAIIELGQANTAQMQLENLMSQLTDLYAVFGSTPPSATSPISIAQKRFKPHETGEGAEEMTVTLSDGTVFRAAGPGSRDRALAQAQAYIDSFTSDFAQRLADWEQHILPLRAQIRELELSLGMTPSFARGGTHRGGLANIAEHDMELVAPSHIYSGPAVKDMLDQRGTKAEIAAMREEQREMSQQMVRLTAQSHHNSERMYRLMSRWNAEGLPEERT